MTAQMSAWWALCRREWLEHRTALCWAPLGLLGLFALAAAFAVGTTNVPDESLSGVIVQALMLNMVRPFAWLYLAAAIMVLLASLFDERKDRTVLFWKSMPVTDAQTVFSKLFVVCVIGSAISASVIICAQVLAVSLASLFLGDLIAAESPGIWGAAELGSSAVNWICGYVSQIFWLLPLWGWLLLVGAVARNLTLFWAAAIPAAIVSVEWVAFNSNYVITSILRHIDLRALPTHIGEHSSAGRASNSLVFELPEYLPQLAELWSSSSMWLGIIVGCLFITAAIFCRRRNNEL